MDFVNEDGFIQAIALIALVSNLEMDEEEANVEIDDEINEFEDIICLMSTLLHMYFSYFSKWCCLT